MKTTNFTKYNPPTQGFYVISFAVSFLLFFGIFCFTFFCPDFILGNTKYLNLAQYIHEKYILSPNIGEQSIGYIYWILQSVAMVCNIIFMWDPIRGFFNATTYRPWLNKYLEEHTKIINSCNVNEFNDRVAMIVFTCNDCVPNTILQTMQQTYKNMDCWICDDSYKPEHLKLIDDFVKDHPEIKLFRRSVEHKKQHPSKVGSLFAWLDVHADEYDYVFENDSSALVTNTFVENCLCYYHSPLLSEYKVGGIIGMGFFYNFKTLVSLINTQTFHFGETHMSGSSARSSGHTVFLQGWGTFYSIKALKDVDLFKVECPCDDVARGANLTSHGYTNFLNPFDFTGKLGIRNIDGWKAQRLKWAGGGVHLLRHKVVWGCMPNEPRRIKLHTFLAAWSGTIFFTLSFINSLAGAILGVFAQINFPNFTSLFFTGVLWAIVVLIFIVLGIKYKASLTTIVGHMFSGVLEASLLFRRLYQVVIKGFILKKWSAAAVTKKRDESSTFKEKLRMCIFDVIWITLFTALSLVLQFVCNFPSFTIWTSFYVFFIGPSLCYILCVFLGEIKIKHGWDSTQSYWPDFYKHNERYRIIKNCNLWKQQHPEDK